MTQRTFIELTVTDSGLSNVASPRRVLVDVALIASIEDMGDNPHAKCYVTLHEAADSTVENDSGEQVARCNKTLMVLDHYETIQRTLESTAVIVRSTVFEMKRK